MGIGPVRIAVESILNRHSLKTELAGSVKELFIAREEDSTARFSEAPGQSSGKLLGVSRFQGEAVDKPFGLQAQLLVGLHFPPGCAQAIQRDQSLYVAVLG